MTSPLRKLMINRKERKILAFHQRYFSAMDETLPEDIFIAGYPKSGNTWFQNLVAGVVFGVMADKSHPRLATDLVPDVHEDDNFYRRYKTPTYFKTHHKPRPAYRNVVYLLRDGRDVMVSYWHHMRAQRKDEVDFLHLAKTGEGLYPCKWHEHVSEWMANPHQARMMIIKYEDLLANTVGEMKRFCEFAGMEIEPAFLQEVCERNAFDKLQTREKRGEEKIANWSKDKLFFRRGVSGSYRDEMPPEVLQAFLADAGGVLKEQGYEI